ncbi:MAG TPA: hypothetical protein VKT80_16840, partial [Chloroflexota bacterium]|nr:hypothetical protein [Chloroflexota bacterium]
MKVLSRLLSTPGAAALVAIVFILIMIVSASATFATGPTNHVVNLPLIRYDVATFLPTPTRTPITTPPPTSTPTATASGDPHYGVIVSSDLPTTMNETGLTWWYQFGAVTPSSQWSSVAQISLRRDDGSLNR